MRDIPLNDYALSHLRDAEWFVEQDRYKLTKMQCANFWEQKEEMLSERYLKEVIDKRQEHDGFPDAVCGHSFTNNLQFSDPAAVVENYEIGSKIQDFMTNICINIGVKRNALFSVYPPGGFITWHNNANAPAYNFIFTWSETGDGWFKFWDINKQEIVTIPDKKGWQCKAGYFGSYKEPDKLCYHAASTECLRMTIAFTLSQGEMSLNWQDDIIEDIRLYK